MAYIDMTNRKLPDKYGKNPKSGSKKRKRGKNGLTPVQGIKYVLSVIGTTFLTLFLIIIITVCIVAVALAVYITQFADNMYDIDLKAVQLNFSSFVYSFDKNEGAEGEWVQTLQIGTDENRVWVDYEEIPQHAIEAVIATEDQRFFEHEGVDWYRMGGAFISTFFRDNEQGGSTITMQLIRDVTGDTNVNIGRKLREMFRAMNMEQKYSKTDILENYLNRIAFGSTTYGIGSAARHYFDKDVSEITLAEAAILAGVIRSPVYNSPYNNPEQTRKRQRYVLVECMYDQGLISYSQMQDALNEKVRFRLPVDGDYFGYVDERYAEWAGLQSRESEDLYFEDVDWEEILETPYSWNEYDVTSDWYTDSAMKQVVTDLAADREITEDSARELLKKGGFKIYLNVDIEMQKKIEEIFRDPAIIVSQPYPAGTDPKDTLQGAFVVIDHHTGSVVALAGGVGDKPGNDCFSRATQSKRNVGSTIKPIAVYGPAVDMNKITYSTYLLDAAGEVDKEGTVSDKETWPRNYELDWGSYAYMPAWQAVMQSKNTISARTLYLVGPQNSYNFLQERLGITSLERSHLTYSALATGSVEIKLHELAAAYQIFGNGGVYYKPYLYSKVEDSTGRVVLQQDSYGVQAVEKESAWVVNRMMKKVIEDPGGSGQYSVLPNVEVVGKTGTANDMANLLFCGLTPDYVGVVRIGYDDNHEIRGIGTDHWRPLARIWSDVMKQLIDTSEPRTFTQPDGIDVKNYCTYTGLLAGSKCPSTNVGYYKHSYLPPVCDDPNHDGTYWQTHAPMETNPYYRNP